MGFSFEKPQPQAQQPTPATDFSDDTNIHIVMPRDEYEDLLNMRSFIYDNNLVIQYELYLDVVKQVEEIKRNELNG